MKKFLAILVLGLLWLSQSASSFEIGQSVYFNACGSSPQKYFSTPLNIKDIVIEVPNKIIKLEKSKYDREFQTLAKSSIDIEGKQVNIKLSNFRNLTISDASGKELEERKVSGATSIYEIKHKDKTIAWGVGWHSWCYKHKAWEEVEFTAFRLYVPYLKNGEIIIQNKLISLKINQIYDALIDGETLILSDGVNILGSDNRNTYFYMGASFFEINNKDGINFDLSFDELKEKINIYKLSPALIISTLSWYNQISALEKYTKENFDEIYEDLNTNYWWNVYEGWRDNDIYELILEKYENYKARITDEEIKNIKKNCLSKNNYNNIYELVRNCYFWHSSWVHSSWAIGSKARAGVAEKKCIEGDCRNGNGTYTFANGDKYVGEFKDGKYHGQGTYTKSDGTVEKGIWENGKLVEPTTPKPKSG